MLSPLLYSGQKSVDYLTPVKHDICMASDRDGLRGSLDRFESSSDMHYVVPGILKDLSIQQNNGAYSAKSYCNCYS